MEQITEDAFEAYLSYLTKLHDVAISLLPKIENFSEERKDLYVIALAASELEFVTASVLLFRKRVAAGIPSIFRSFLEAHIDFLNLAADPDYYRSLQLEWSREWLRVLESADGLNPYLAGIAEHDGFDTSKTMHGRSLEDLADQGVRRLTKRDKFERADMAEEYESIYNFVSAETHNNLRSLFKRHISRSENGITIRVNGWNYKSMLPALDTLNGLFYETLCKLNERFELDCGDQITELETELASLRELPYE